MAKNSAKKANGKRTYKHSDAWIEAHQKKLAKNAGVKKMAIKRKPTKKVELTKKAAKKQDRKFDIKKLNSLFEDAKKKNAAIKNVMKQLSEEITKMFADGFDEKTYSKLLKKIEFYGFTFSDGILAKDSVVKVKLPKSKDQLATGAEKPKNAMKPDAVDNNEDADDIADEKEAAAIPDVETDEPSSEELEELENEEEYEDDEELDDFDNEGLDEDEIAQRREDRRIAKEYERDCKSDFDNAINDAMRDNGDWD